MTNSRPPAPMEDCQYQEIEAALLESERGRRFLSEVGRRNRSPDTQILLEAIAKLETAIARPKPTPNSELIRRDLIDMSEAITRTRREISAIRPSDSKDSQLITATEELDAIVQSTEKATSDILEAAEDIQEMAWLMREANVEGAYCDRLDQRAMDIYTACSFQDITGQRTQKVVQALHYLESRVISMIEIWGLDDEGSPTLAKPDERPDAHLLSGPQLEGRGMDQDDVDPVIGAPELEMEVIEAVAAAVSGAASAAGAASSPEPAPASKPRIIVTPARANEPPPPGEQATEEARQATGNPTVPAGRREPVETAAAPTAPESPPESPPEAAAGAGSMGLEATRALRALGADEKIALFS